MLLCDLILIFIVVSSSGLLLQHLMRVLPLPPALIIHHSSVVPVWIERSVPLIQEGSCWNSFLRFESVCSKLRPDLKWRSMEVWQDHRLVLITEPFERCTLPLRQDGREMCFHASRSSFSMIWLGPWGRTSLQIPAWRGPEAAWFREGTNSGTAELCLYLCFVNTLAEISRDFFLCSGEKIDIGWRQVQYKCSLK